MLSDRDSPEDVARNSILILEPSLGSLDSMYCQLPASGIGVEVAGSRVRIGNDVNVGTIIGFGVRNGVGVGTRVSKLAS